MADAAAYKRIGHLKDLASFRAHLEQLDLRLPVDDRLLPAAQGSPLAQPLAVGGFTVGNRWCIHPMEGWDGTLDGRPTDLTIRRWENFGRSGAKLIWGGEAFAVQFDGRANPNQLYYRAENTGPMRDLLQALLAAHRQRFGAGSTDDLLVGLQLTHSGRFSRPHHKARLEPRIAYHHPVLDRRCGIDPADSAPLLSDDDIHRLIQNYIVAARMAQAAGFGFVDVKHCHGYLGHEFLSAYDRPGPFGGDLHGRSNFLRQIVQGIRAACPGLLIGVRLSLFDMPPFQPDPQRSTAGKLGPGIPEHTPLPYPIFGASRRNPLQMDLSEPIVLLKLMRDELKIDLVNLSAGSPYYNPHMQRPAYFPPSDGYQPPEDPLIGCLRQIEAVRRVKQAVAGLPLVGSAYSYFQEWLPQVAQAVVRAGWVDAVGIGRGVLSYWDMPADTLDGAPLRQKHVCRTFSDCTTAPRNGIVSGCFPLDEHYKKAPEAEALKAAKEALRRKLTATGPQTQGQPLVDR